METIASVSGVIAGFLSLLSFVLYYISILRKKTSPNRATWFILTIVGVLIFASYYSLGATNTLWLPASFIIGPFIAFLLSIKYGEGGWTSFDKVCLLVSGASLLIWFFSGLAIITLIINILIDLVGILPTLKKSYERPSSEESFPWLVTFISCIFNVLAINTWSFDIWIYPIYMLIINGLLALLLYFPSFARKPLFAVN